MTENYILAKDLLLSIGILRWNTTFLRCWGALATVFLPLAYLRQYFSFPLVVICISYRNCFQSWAYIKVFLCGCVFSSLSFKTRTIVTRLSILISHVEPLHESEARLTWHIIGLHDLPWRHPFLDSPLGTTYWTITISLRDSTRWCSLSSTYARQSRYPLRHLCLGIHPPSRRTTKCFTVVNLVSLFQNLASLALWT